jgi:hypothetical protein
MINEGQPRYFILHVLNGDIVLHFVGSSIWLHTTQSPSAKCRPRENLTNKVLQEAESSILFRRRTLSRVRKIVWTICNVMGMLYVSGTVLRAPTSSPIYATKAGIQIDSGSAYIVLHHQHAELRRRLMRGF